MPLTWSDEVWAAFKSNSRPGPIYVPNLIRYRDKAAYPDGRDVTGEVACAEYGRTSAPIFKRVGGRMVWRGNSEQMTTGPSEEAWDLAFIAKCPSTAAFVEMLEDPDYQVAVKNRRCAISDSRLIRMEPLPIGETFGG